MEQIAHDTEPTCGKGIAANAALPAKLAALLASQAEVLKRHAKALDLTDSNTQLELDAYTSLERAQRGVANDLARLAEEMAGYRSLPMGRHDMAVMIDPNGQMDAFRQFVALEREILELLQAKLKIDEAMLG